MDSFGDRIAVVTGGGTGMGRELVRQLAAEGCHVATCDVSEENMTRTRALALAGAPAGVRVTTHEADVSDESQLERFRDEVMREHETDCVHLVFNNAGIGGAGSMIVDERESWERTFDICWYGVYYGTRVFLPLLMAAEEGHLVNTSSVNGFWATLGPGVSHTAYSAAKFAVKGFSEALINDLASHAPHVKVSVVMPGHVGTSIVINSGRILGNDPKQMSDEDFQAARERLERRGVDFGSATNEQLRQVLVMQGESFRDDAPTTAESAVRTILEGVRAGRWRILVGHDAEVLDRLVREDPEGAYTDAFYERLVASTNWRLGQLSG
ncbi:MAG: SDR family NAD(P)-dependent oxidoreductase [Spirochaetaceae bacterium]|nr:SDR family NAD(P)-dependent oxidoreductase [Myxococcales bacterium]MCB9724236.1 SDR family NAD(P)-dependent oxidoreductase [Spirochaetaceae bacterium]